MNWPGVVEYKKGWFVWPKTDCGPLAVFKDYESALKFSIESFEVWECDYRPSKRDKLHYIDRLGVLVRLNFGLTPNGTVFAEAVRLIRRCD